MQHPLQKQRKGIMQHILQWKFLLQASRADFMCEIETESHFTHEI